MNANLSSGQEQSSQNVASPHDVAFPSAVQMRSTARVSIARIFLFVTVLCVFWAALQAGVGRQVAGAGNAPESISIDYPLNASIFPPDIAAPTFQWRDPAPNAGSWQIDVSFPYLQNHLATFRVVSQGIKCSFKLIQTELHS